MNRFITCILSILLFLNTKGQDVLLPRIIVNDSAKKSISPALPSHIDNALVSSPIKDTLSLRLDKLNAGKPAEKRKKKTPDQAFWNLSVNGGYEIRIAAVPYGLPEDLEQYKNGLRYGGFVGANSVMFITDHIGLGLKYNMFKTSNQAYLDYRIDDDMIFKGTRSDNISFHYIGPSLSLRSIPKRNKIYANYDFSIGYAMYHNNIAVDGVPYTVTGNNVGFMSSFGTDFMLTNEMSLGLQVNISAASINKIKLANHKFTLNDDDTENMSRISIGLVIKYYK